MRNDGWIGGVAALIVLSGLTGALLALAIRPVAVPSTEPAAGVSSPMHRARPMLCVSTRLVCAAPPLPAGYPCTCMHPLRGIVGGRVTSADDADSAMTVLPGTDRRLQPEEFFGP